MDIERVKRLRRSLTLHFSAIAVITAILVANNGSGNVVLPALILLVTTTAYVLVDRLEIFYLGQIGSYVGMTVATLLAIITLGVAVFNENESAQMNSVASLLIYPQCVLFFQKKSLRVFEQLAVFLLLQMIIAALINDNIVYGVLLTPMLLMWVSSLFLFARYATIVSLSPEIETPIPLLYELIYATFIKRAIRRKNVPPPVRAVALVEPATLNARGGQRWLLSGPLAITALTFAGSLFYFLPRNGQGNSLGSLSLDKTGIPNSIDAGYFGRVLADNTPVLRLKLSQDGATYRPIEPPYLRVDVFDEYYPPSRPRATGNWRRAPSSRPRFVPTDAVLHNRDQVNLEVKGKNTPGRLSSKILVSLPPLINSSKEFTFDQSKMVFEQINESHRLARKKVLLYGYVTNAFDSGRQVEITPIPSRSDGSRSDGSRSAITNLTELPVSLAGAEVVRRNILSQAGIDPTNFYAIAKTLESYFRDSGEFTYSLDVPPLHEPMIDPIEDFIVNTKTGLCQHYASALTALLRKSNVPSRIVIGYRPVEWNKMGEFFQVRMRDAHAWVEARVSRENLIGTIHEKWLTNAEYYWLRLDPTPDSENVNPQIKEENKPLDFAEDLWDDYLAYPESNGIQASFDPMTADSQAQAKQLMNRLTKISQAILGDWFLGLGFAWQLTLTIFVLGGLPVVLSQLVRWLPKFAPNLASRLGLVQPRGDIQQAFYARCIALLETLKLKRSESETLHEFSHRARETIESRTAAPGTLRHALHALGDLYHRMRFGPDSGWQTDNAEEIERHLATVEAAVKQAKKVGSR